MTRGGRRIVNAVQFWLSRPMKGRDELVDALATRAREVVPLSVCVRVDHGTIIIDHEYMGMRRAFCIMVGVAIQKGLDTEQALLLAAQVFGRGLQDAMSKVTGEPWPAPKAHPGYRVDNRVIAIWWGGKTEAEAVMRLRPISRTEIHLE